MHEPKIRLSPPELELFCNAEMILTKNTVLQKTVELLSNVQNEVLARMPALFQTSPYPKISKGENYLGLPYVVLDYPRIAGGEDLFFIRSFFWWGNFYSSTLQLSGRFKTDFCEKVERAYPLLAATGYFVGTGEDPWVHHFQESNYRKISGLSAGAFATVLEERKHIKVAAHWPLPEWDAAEKNLVKSWSLLMELIA